jgi:uncharacterized protein (TIRG00374 family)
VQIEPGRWKGPQVLSSNAEQEGKRPQLGSWLRHRWRLLVGVALSGLCLYLALHGISLVALRKVVSITQWEWAALAVAVVVISSSLKAVRWRALFLPQRLPLGRTWAVFMIGQMLNALLPARAGEVGRIYFIGEDKMVSRATALSTVVVEKVVDLVMLTLAYFVVALWLAVTPTGVPDWLQNVGTALIPLTVLALGGLLLLTYVGHPMWRLLRKGLKPLPPRWQSTIDTAADRAITALKGFRSGEAGIQVWSLSLVIWILMTSTNALVFSAFGLDLSLFVAILLLVVLMSGVSAPPLPGNLGVFVYLCVLVLSLFGVDRELALVYGITLQVVAYLPQIVLGLISLLWQNWFMRDSGRRPSSTSPSSEMTSATKSHSSPEAHLEQQTEEPGTVR